MAGLEDEDSGGRADASAPEARARPRRQRSACEGRVQFKGSNGFAIPRVSQPTRLRGFTTGVKLAESPQGNLSPSRIGNILPLTASLATDAGFTPRRKRRQVLAGGGGARLLQVRWSRRRRGLPTVGEGEIGARFADAALPGGKHGTQTQQ